MAKAKKPEVAGADGELFFIALIFIQIVGIVIFLLL